jgi:hypothetical protein
LSKNFLFNTRNGFLFPLFFLLFPRMSLTTFSVEEPITVTAPIVITNRDRRQQAMLYRLGEAVFSFDAVS